MISRSVKLSRSTPDVVAVYGEQDWFGKLRNLPEACAGSA